MGVGSDSTNETEENKFVDVTKHSGVTEDNVFISKSSISPQFMWRYNVCLHVGLALYLCGLLCCYLHTAGEFLCSLGLGFQASSGVFNLTEGLALSCLKKCDQIFNQDNICLISAGQRESRCA